MAKVLDTLRKLKENRQYITVNLGNESIQLKRVDAATYQMALQEVTEEMEEKEVLSAAFSFDYTAKCVTRVIDGIDMEEAKEMLVSFGGLTGDFAKGVMEACGMKQNDLMDDIDEGDGGN